MFHFSSYFAANAISLSHNGFRSLSILTIISIVLKANIMRTSINNIGDCTNPFVMPDIETLLDATDLLQRLVDDIQ